MLSGRDRCSPKWRRSISEAQASVTGITALIAVLAALAATSVAVLAVVMQLPAVWLWHAGLMVAAWGVLVPAGAMIARFCKVMPGQDWPRVLDNKTWWHAHLALQYAGVLVMSSAAATMAFDNGLRLESGHARWGACAMVLAWAQIIAAGYAVRKADPLNLSCVVIITI